MVIIRTTEELKKKIISLRSEGKSIGFVPTMGALHIGHVSLIKQAKENNDIVICSIFVNPNQFNDKNDLVNYPRMEDQDCILLKENSCDLVFIPAVEEVYPEPDSRNFEFGILDKILEGKFRPGHFNGVAQVVSRLFDLVNPHRAYFGLKDYQQVMIIKKLVDFLNLDVEIIPCEIVRESDGLAFSSRNALLTEEERKLAPVIYKLLKKAEELISGNSIEFVKQQIVKDLQKYPLLRLDYFEICRPETLSIINPIENKVPAIALIAVFIGKVRLIDNHLLNN